MDWEDRVYSCLVCQAGTDCRTTRPPPSVLQLLVVHSTSSPMEMNTFGFIWPTMKGFDSSSAERVTAVLVQCPER